MAKWCKRCFVIRPDEEIQGELCQPCRDLLVLEELRAWSEERA